MKNEQTMSKEKQIEEMAKVISNIPPIEFPFGSRLQGRRIYTSTKIAEHLYNENYRKQSEGEWIKKDGFLVCSVCDATKPIAFSTVLKITYYKCDYCNRCGAKMKGGAE